MKGIRILLVDGRELVRQGLRRMLEQEEDMKVVGDYASAEEALSEMARLHQDIVLMGTQMPGMNWIEATHNLTRNRLSSSGDIIILAESPERRADALEAGAASYLLKDITRVELAQAIRQVYRNRHPVKEYDGLVEDAIELVVLPPANASWLLRFMCHLGELLHDDFASIICTVGSWDRGTVITIRPHYSVTASTLLITLANIPEVEKVEEEALARNTFTDFTRKFGLLPRLGINPSKRIRVTLKESSIAGQELVTILK